VGSELAGKPRATYFSSATSTPRNPASLT